jgi:hypothetical protein
VESRTKETVILRYGGRLYKVLEVRTAEKNYYTLECRNLESKQSRVFKYKLVGYESAGLLDALDRAFSTMKSPKDILFLDLDGNGKWQIVSEDQLRKLLP